MRFNRWSKNGTIQKIFEKMQELNIIDVRTDMIYIESTSIKVHTDAAGARKSSGKQSIGRSKGGLTTEIHLYCASEQYAFVFHLSAGNNHDAPEGRKLIETKSLMKWSIFMPKGKPKYTGKMEQQIIEDIITNKLSQCETANKYRISRHSVQNWERIYLEERVEELYIERRGRKSTGRPPKIKKDIE